MYILLDCYIFLDAEPSFVVPIKRNVTLIAVEPVILLFNDLGRYTISNSMKRKLILKIL